MSPCGQNIVTGAGDETLRFWTAFPLAKGKSGDNVNYGSFGGNNIRSTLVPSSIDIR